MYLTKCKTSSPPKGYHKKGVTYISIQISYFWYRRDESSSFQVNKVAFQQPPHVHPQQVSTVSCFFPSSLPTPEDLEEAQWTPPLHYCMLIINNNLEVGQFEEQGPDDPEGPGSGAGGGSSRYPPPSHRSSSFPQKQQAWHGGFWNLQRVLFVFLFSSEAEKCGDGGRRELPYLAVASFSTVWRQGCQLPGVDWRYPGITTDIQMIEKIVTFISMVLCRIESSPLPKSHSPQAPSSKSPSIFQPAAVIF